MRQLFARIDRKFHGKFYESRFHIKLHESFSFSLCLKEEFLTHGKSLALGRLEGSQANWREKHINKPMKTTIMKWRKYSLNKTKIIRTHT